MVVSLKQTCRVVVATLVLGSATSVFAKSSSFDDVVFNDEVVETMTPLGFGGTKVLNVVEHPSVREKYEELRLQGSIEVLVQKLPAKKLHETKTTRFTFIAWKRTGFTTRKKVASLQVDVYSDTRIMDASPSFYRVGDLSFFP